MSGTQIFGNYFFLTRKDRTGIITIVLLICLALFIPKLLKKTTSERQSIHDTRWILALQKLEIKEPENDRELPVTRTENSVITYQFDLTKNPYKSELFFFDPNSTSSEEWQKLGLRDKTIQTILNYISKGGSFSKPEDLRKVYGLRDDDYKRLAPFIRIAEKKNISRTHTTATKEPAAGKTYAVIDINEADTTAFIALPGIGSKLSARIINFREKLGGFYSVEQIKETYGLPDSTFRQIKSYLKLGNADDIKKIHLNNATRDELKAHPYIQYNIANAIVAYRNQHGPFSKVEDIKNLMIVTDELYNRVSLYLTVQ